MPCERSDKQKAHGHSTQHTPTMSTFRVGQRVICVSSGLWFNEESKTFDDIGPAKGDICRISHIDPDGYLGFEEWPNGEDTYEPSSFRPLDSLTKQMLRIENELIQQPQPA